MQPRLGSFILQEPIGRGGMGAVWRAEHATQGVSIAVKVDLHPPDAVHTAAFLHEVEAIAALDHRHVVVVLEHGVVDVAAQRASDGEMRAGSRWLAMELASGGSVAEHPPRNWNELRHVTTGLLEALAHSHARGVVHRDIKPANLLLAGSEVGISTRPSSLLDARVVLSDFGISERRELPSTHTEESVGTPTYMAPEQIEAFWRDQGPWTDLYAVGILLWRLSTGRSPFEGRNAFQIYRQHLLAPPPAFVPTMGVPEGFEAILRRCLEKAPEDRYAYAARLERDLEALGLAFGSMEATPMEDEATQRAPVTQGLTRQRHHTTEVGTRQRNFQLQSAGLSLFGLRTPPLVGRESICDALWGCLVETRATGQARVVVLRGAVGSGKTRLASWLCDRAHELGICDSLRATHRAEDLPFDGLRRMLVEALRTQDLHGDELDERLMQRFPTPDFDLRALAALLDPSADGPRLTGREARVLVLSVVTSLARQESLVVHLDDAHHDLETLEWVDHLLALQTMRPSPVLVVVTVRDDALSDRAEIEELLHDVQDDPATRVMPVPPLSSRAQAKLVAALVGLEGAVAGRLEERTAGNPLFAVQLIGSWIEQGVLVPGPAGFEMDADAEARMPADLHTLWAGRVRAFLDGRGAEDALALESAAAIGMQVDHAGWLRTFPLLEIDPQPDLFAELARRHLISLDDASGSTWSFVHGGLRELLITQAREEDRWHDVNLAAAIQLQQSGVRAPRRLARHLLAAEVWEQAAEPLSAAIADDVDRGDVRDDRFVEELDQVLKRLQLPPEDAWWARLLLIRAGRARIRRELDESERLALKVLRYADRFGWKSEGGMALREASRVMFANSNLEKALSFAVRAQQRFEELGDPMRAADTMQTIGLIHSRRGENDIARDKLLRSVEAIEAGGWRGLLHESLLGLALLEQRAGNLDAARDWLTRCHTHAESYGLSAVLANCANLRGEIARKQGDLEEAATWYRESTDRYQVLDSRSFVYPALNLALLDVQADRFAVAVERMRMLLTWLRQNPQPILVTYAHVILFAAEAGAGSIELATESLFKVANDLSTSSVADADIALMAERGGVLLAAAGSQRDARRAMNLAIKQYRALGRDADAERLEADW